MTSSPGQPARLPTEAGPHWTTRQREVLELLATGRTNAEIAGELGVSLDGAKWHVREVMAKLQVDTREEAAHYWRQRNGLRARVWRARLGLGFAAHGLRYAVGAAALAAAVAGAAVVLALRGGDDGTGADAPLPQAAVEDATPAVAPVPAPSPTAAPTEPEVLTTIGGLPVYELKVVSKPAELPAGSMLYYVDYYAASTELFRFARSDSGEWRSEPLLRKDHPGLPRGRPLSPMLWDGGGRFAALWCLTDTGPCRRKETDGSGDSGELALVVSTDGGVTWAEVARVPRRSFALRFIDSEVLLAIRNGSGSGDFDYRLYPSDTPAAAPSADSWLEAPDGSIFRTGDPGSGDGIANEGSMVFSVVTPGQPIAAYFAFPGGWLGAGHLVSRTLLLGAAGRSEKATLNNPPRNLGGFFPQAVLVDLELATVAPLAGLIGADGTSQSILPIALVPGPFLRVSNAETCLNVRERPDLTAPVVGCLRDGVLVRDRGERQTTGGITWAAVSDPRGHDGWASLEFLSP
ncbi:MAG: LuxR C-terminal-related transcriptional regulator [Chloroflexota bacterium]